ncbi:inositol 1,4,5-trisphosphate receptor [Trypanosoma equiperdum]|uniref:Inositol 1,4,5-trisphosphate receptor n=1 Tax=Trypanosoma equiperdum TaxID=5694 RepID=A0A1G4I324_TRYEQ|nr:inositol 1,4,5-trisphosphate receptor [Trypanosoma equiperdum]
MSQSRVPIRYGAFIHLSCDEGYVTAGGLGNEGLFIRNKNELSDDAEPLPLFGFETSVFQILPPTVAKVAAEEGLSKGNRAPNSNPLSDGVSNIYSTQQVTFGQLFVLVHAVSRLHVAALPSEPSERDPDCARLVLAPPGEIEQTFCQFIFTPRYTTHGEGDVVCRGDEVLVQLASIPIFLQTTVVSPTRPVKHETFGSASFPYEPTDGCGRGNSWSAGTRMALSAVLGAPEVNLSEAKALVFVVERYDIDRDKAEHQRILHRIPRPCVSAGVPVIFYHLEHKRVLATSVAMPPCQGGGKIGVSGVAPRGNEGGGERDHLLKTRQTHSVMGNVTVICHASGRFAAAGSSKSPGSDSHSAGATSLDSDPCSTKGKAPDDRKRVNGVGGAALPLFAVDKGVADGTFSEEGALSGLQCSCTALWILENEQPTVGGAVNMNSGVYRLRQACSNLYVAVEGSAVDTILEGDGSPGGSVVSQRSCCNLTGDIVNEEGGDVVRPTTLSMIPPPRTPKDLQRTLFRLSPMFNTDCGYLIENDCLLLQNVATDMYLCTSEGSETLSLSWKPSNIDLIVVRRAATDVQDSVLFLWSQCETLSGYRDAFQVLTTEGTATHQQQTETDGEHGQGRYPSAEGSTSPTLMEGRMAIVSDYNHIPESFVRPSKTCPKGSNVGTGYASLLPVICACQRTLAELIIFCSISPERNVLRRDGIPIPNHQHMLVELCVHRLVIDVILAPFSKFGVRADRSVGKHAQCCGQWGCSSWLPPLPLSGGVVDVNDLLLKMHREIHIVCRLGFRLLRQMVRQAPELKAGFENYIPYFLAFDGYKLEVVDSLTRLFSENPAVRNSSLELVVNHYIAGLHLTRSGRYLQLLCSMCSVGTHGVTERQRLVCQKLLVENANALYSFVLDSGGEWAVKTDKDEPPIPCNILFSGQQQDGGEEEGTKLREYVQSELELLGALCLDGCPPLCREEVAKVFPSPVLLMALRNFSPKWPEVSDRSRVCDVVRSHLIRLAMHCYILPYIDDPAVQLREGAVLLGSSKLHLKVDEKTAFSGKPDSELTQAVKEGTLHVIRSNTHFVRSDTGRSILIRAALAAWLRFVSAHQVSATETACLVPLLLELLDSRDDDAHDGSSKIAEYTWTRLEVSEAGLLVVRAREMICQILLQILETATYRAANEINLLLHGILVTDHGASLAHQHDYCSLLRRADVSSTGDPFVTSPTERDALLWHKGKANDGNGNRCFGLNRRKGPSDYQSTVAGSAVTTQLSGSTKDVAAFLDYVKGICSCIVRPLRVDQLVPRLVDLAHHDGSQLAPYAMELLVRICTVRRSVARLVLQVHPFPSSEVIQCFDNMYFAAVQVRSSYIRGSVEEAIDVALQGIDGLSTQTQNEVTGTTNEGRVDDGGTDEYYNDLTEDDEEIEEIGICEEQEVEASSSSAPEDQHEVGGESKARRLWSKAAGAARIVVYRNAIIARRRSVGLSETSRVPLRVVVRAETVRHWQVHITMLEMYPFIGPSSPAFSKWMRFFYVFTLSQSNAESLKAYIDIFMGAFNLSSNCVVMGLHIVLSILATIKDPTPHLTDAFLRESARYIDGEIAALHPDGEFATKLGLHVFTKTTVGGIPRRRMLQLLRDYDAFRCLPSPGVTEKHGRGRFTACIVEMVCRICGTSMGAVALGRSALPVTHLLEITLSYGTSYTPLVEVPRPRALWESNSFHLLGAYLLALVSLYIAAGDAGGDGGRRQRQMEWMANRDWWSVVLLLSRQLKELTRLMQSRTETVLWRGRRILQRYRRLWLVNLPLALLTFMTECFNEAGFYRYRDVVGATFHEMCMSVAGFSEVLLASADAIRLQAREMVGYRRLVALLQVQTGNLVGHELLSGTMLTTRRNLRHGVICYYKKINEAEEEARGLHPDALLLAETGPQAENDGIQGGLIATADVPTHTQNDADDSSPMGLLISGAATKCLDAERLRGALRSLVNRDQLITMEDSTDLGEPAGIMNALLLSCRERSNVLDFVSTTLGCMRERSFGSITLIGMLNIFSNALHTALREQERERLKHVSAENSSVITDIFTVRSFETDYAKENAGRLLQTTFSDLGATRAIASLCAVDDQVVAYSAVQLCVGLLEGGNEHAQKALLAYFQEHQERFFHNIRDMLHKAVDWVQCTNAEHQIVVLERGGVVPNVSNAHEFTRMLLTNALTTPPSLYSSLKVRVGRGTAVARRRLSAWDRAGGSLNQRFVCTLFRMLQLFCEGHNLSMQNYIRSQYDNLHSVNAVHEVMNLITEIAAVVHPATVRMLQSAFALLTELCQGPCHENQEALLGYGVCVVISKLLSRLNLPDVTGTPSTGTGITNWGGGDSNSTDNKASVDCCTLNETDSEGNAFLRLQGGFLLSKDDAGNLRIALTQCLLSLIEGCRSRDVFHQLLEQIPVEVIERELTTVDPGAYDSILENEELASDPGVEALFNWLIFLKTVRPYAEADYLKRIDAMLQHTNKLCTRLGFIEIQRADGMLEKVLFRIPHVWRGLMRRNRKQMLAEINCSSRAAKLGDFMYHSDNVIFEVERSYAFQCWVERRTRWRLDNRSSGWRGKECDAGKVDTSVDAGKPRWTPKWKQCSDAPKYFWNHFIAPVLFCTHLGFYEYSSLLVAVVLNIALINGEGRHRNLEESQLWANIISGLCVLQLVLSLIAITVDTIVFFPVSLYVHYRQKQQRFSGRAKFNETLQGVLRGLSAKEISLLLVTRFSFQYRLLLVVMAVLSIFVSYYFAAAHLTLMVYTFPTLRTFVSAITHNGRQLLLTALLGVMGLYLFAIAGRIMFPEQFGSNGEVDENSGKKNDENGNCDTLLRCFTFILWQGLRQGGGVGDVMDEVSWNSSTLVPRVSYDLIFFALVNVVFLNIMFGIIIDTFGELRDDRRERENELRSTCFICGLDADTLEKGQVGGFRAHVEDAHNMWMYLYFIHYLRHKDPNEFTGQESYVHEKIQRNDLSFFPEEDCLALQECREGNGKRTGDDEADSDDELASSVVVGGSAPRGPKPESAHPDTGVKLVLKELAAVREAVSALAREATMEGERTRGLAQQLELINRSSQSSSLRKFPGGGSAASVAETSTSKGTWLRHSEPEH